MRDAFSNHWRRWLTHRFLDGYLSERKYYDIGNSRDIDNPTSASAKTSTPSPAAPRTSCSSSWAR